MVLLLDADAHRLRACQSVGSISWVYLRGKETLGWIAYAYPWRLSWLVNTQEGITRKESLEGFKDRLDSGKIVKVKGSYKHKLLLCLLLESHSAIVCLG